MNNILIYSKTLKKHKNYVKKVLTCFMKRNLRLKSEKYEFHKEKIDFLRFIVGKQGIKIDFTKLKVVRK